MVKRKQRQMTRVPTNKNASAGEPNNFSNANTEVALHEEEDDWVMVRKQIVTILVPPLPVSKKFTTSSPGQSHPQPKPKKQENNQSEVPITCPTVPLVDEQNDSLLDFKKGIRATENNLCAQPIAKSPGPSRLSFRMETVKQNRGVASNVRKALAISKTSKAIKWPGLVHCPSRFLDGGGVLLNQRMRALNLERKLQKAGGVRRWLESLGLEQFIRIFQGKSLNKFQLVNLTMKKLKDMGTNAVGPRRKLMHAINCICQPYSFDAF